jgi:signal transduction histidine kinase
VTTAAEQTSPERQQTDESLRVEREKADIALEERLFDEIADAVISRARGRADGVLSAARAKSDRRSTPDGGKAPATVVKERKQEDEAVREERATADAVLKEERAEHVAVLSLERKETDRDLVHERDRADDALATRDEFLAIVSHDLRALLHGVVGFAGLIAHEVAGEKYGPSVVEDAQRILRSGARMNRLIGDLVDVASIHAGTLAVSCQPDDAGAIVAEAIDTFQSQAAARGLKLMAELVPPLRATFDPPRLLQVLSNLLSNAIKFTPAKGKVTVHVEQLGDELRFSVSDTGPGIPPGKLVAVFERYLQVDPGDRRGVGLGLYISRCIVQGHGGRIWAESKLGQGTTFLFTVPVHTATPQPAAA